MFPHEMIDNIKGRCRRTNTGCAAFLRIWDMTDIQSLPKGVPMKIVNTLLVLLALLTIAGCSTSASFKLPPNTSLLIRSERVAFEPAPDPSGRPVLETTPFFWDAVMDIKYSLVKDDKIVKEGKLPSQFRVISIFWPPFAYIYWPFGFRLNCYDLTKDFIEECQPEAPKQRPVSAN
jgi:hypothetical protein